MLLHHARSSSSPPGSSTADMLAACGHHVHRAGRCPSGTRTVRSWTSECASPARLDDIGYAVLAEELGYSHLWFADSQMLWSDCYATMALAGRPHRADQDRHRGRRRRHPLVGRDRGGPRDDQPLAPGRVFCGIGSGNTANRVMGAKPMPIAEFERYIAELRLLLDGSEAEVAFRGGTRPVRHLMPDAGFVAFEPRMPLYVSAFGPRAMAARRAPRRRAGHVGPAHRRGPVAAVGPPRAAGRRRRHARSTGRRSSRHADDDGRAAAGRDARQRAGPASRPGRWPSPPCTTSTSSGRSTAGDRRTPRSDFWDDYVGDARRGHRPSGCTSASTRATTAGCSPRRSAS